MTLESFRSEEFFRLLVPFFGACQSGHGLLFSSCVVLLLYLGKNRSPEIREGFFDDSKESRCKNDPSDLYKGK